MHQLCCTRSRLLSKQTRSRIFRLISWGSPGETRRKTSTSNRQDAVTFAPERRRSKRRRSLFSPSVPQYRGGPGSHGPLEGVVVCGPFGVTRPAPTMTGMSSCSDRPLPWCTWKLDPTQPSRFPTPPHLTAATLIDVCVSLGPASRVLQSVSPGRRSVLMKLRPQACVRPFSVSANVLTSAWLTLLLFGSAIVWFIYGALVFCVDVLPATNETPASVSLAARPGRESIKSLH